LKPLALAGGAVFFGAAPAWAHTITPGTTGFTDGLTHPFTNLPQILVLLAVGLLLGQRDLAQLRRPLLAWLIGLAAGLAFAPFAAGRPWLADLPLALLSLAVVVALVVIVARPLPPALLAAGALAASLGIGLDSAPEGGTAQQTVAALAGSWIAAALALLNVVILANHVAANRLRHPWQPIGMRIIASWIAAAGLMVLALSLRLASNG
jgi:hydrogenase/urease accessory protein HupE